MINILSYLGMNMQSEVCLWTLLGLVRTIFDATLFKVNANLKQVWQMTMPSEISMPVQRVLRTMISGVMLVQCFTVYVYLASYIVLLYPVFLEERPTLVLPWLLLAAIRKLLCELTSLALGLGTCVLLGPAKPPCIKFVIIKVASIMPAFYMWMLVFSYYHALKVASAFKTFPAVHPTSDHDYGLELAVRRRRTKSLLGEEQLRKKLVANYYGDSNLHAQGEVSARSKIEISSRMVHSTDMSLDDLPIDTDTLPPMSTNMTQSYEDWSGSEVTIPRDTDRILEQIVLMLLRIGAYLKTEGMESINNQILSTSAAEAWGRYESIDGPVIPAEGTETPPLVGSKGNTASYLLEYPQIFNRKASSDVNSSEKRPSSIKTVHSQIENTDPAKSKKRVVSALSDESVLLESNRKRMSLSLAPQKNLQIDLTTPNQPESEQLSTAKQEVIKREEDSTLKEQEQQLRNDNKSRSEECLKLPSESIMNGGKKNHKSESKESSKEDKNKRTDGASTSHKSVKENKISKTSKTDSLNKSKKNKPPP